MPATKVGITKGSISRRKTVRRPAKSIRASTHAAGTPKAVTKTQVKTACATVQPKRRRI